MNLEALKEKPMFQITAGEFLFLQRNYDLEVPSIKVKPEINTKHVYGILGIAKLLGCSKSSANRIKKSGVINKAIIQNGRKIIVDAELALELIKKAE